VLYSSFGVLLPTEYEITPKSRSKQNGKHWKVLENNDVLRTYSQAIHSLVKGILLNIDDDHPSEYKFPLTQEMVESGKSLSKAIDSTADNSLLLSLLHQVLYPCFSVSHHSGEYSKWNDVLECFMAILALEDDGNFQTAAQMTQFFAILKYICRCTQLYESVERIGDFDNDIMR
jgi:hypothetical protein